MSTIKTPAPILRIDNYPKAPFMSSSSNALSTSLLPTSQQYRIQTASLSLIESQHEEKEYTILSTPTNKLMYYYQEPSIMQSQAQQPEEEEVIFYNQYKQPIWKLMNRDWHGMTLIYHQQRQQQQHITTLSTTPPPDFRFTYNQTMYYWTASKVKDIQKQYTLKCYDAETKRVIAQLEKDQLLLLDIIPPVVSTTTTTIEQTTIETNPFRKSSGNASLAETDDDPFTTLIMLSGLFVHHHIKILLKSLGGGPEALEIILQPPPLSPEDDGTSASIMSSRHPYYPGHANLVEEHHNTRWSSAASFKSIELDPSVWHCWWGDKFWWSWFPCCMPGGLCDCVRLKGRRNTTTTARSRSLSKKGWQQQHY